MSFMTVAPAVLASAASDLASLGSVIDEAHATAAASTTTVAAAAGDEVSANIAHVFSVHAQDYQGLAGQAAAFHEQFVRHLIASAGSYHSTEAASAAVLKPANANAGSFVGAIGVAIGVFLNQLVDLFIFVWEQSLNLLVSFLNLLFGLITLPLVIIGQLIGFIERLILFPITILEQLF